MKNCGKCGALIDEKDIYCPRCGFKNRNETPDENINENHDENDHVINLNKDDYKEESYKAQPDSGYESLYNVVTEQNQPKDFDALCLVGFILTFFGGSVVSLILCIIGVVNFDEKTKKGKGFGIAGIIINAVLLALMLIFIIIFMIILFGFAYAWPY